MKKLGFGMMRLPLVDPNDPKSIDLKQTCEMVDAFLDRGFTYFDTAWMYHRHESEKAVKDVLVSRHDRDSFTLATKLHSSFMESAADRDRIFDEQRRKTGVEYFDYYLLHDMTDSHFEKYKKYDCFDWISMKKEKGEARHIGFSHHGDEVLLDRVLTENPEFEFVQLQVNYLDWDSDSVRSRRCVEVARKHGKKIVVMEPVKGGTLAKVPESVEKLFKGIHPELSVPSWAIRFAAGLDGVFMVLSGMSSMEQLLDNTGYMRDFKPLTPDERKTVEMAAALINNAVTIPCTGCSYCTEGCPMQIDIPRAFALYNADNNDTGSGESGYEQMLAASGDPGDCLGCGQCEGMCPQHLPIIEDLSEVAAYFG